ncbi:regulatory protein RecX [Miniphocaeibacter massiliensis]|uniref:regulatory protein RecX n=1 Tax=Miniphocaeibacter massiliensis TaxID=2041841 RepID=UPI000C06D74D|nr:RecX family transcriptional regulator [Miniphocaeibacter massiliensis]
MIIKEIIFKDTLNFFEIITDTDYSYFADCNLYNDLNLSVGMVLSEKLIKSLEAFTEKQKLISKILNYISYRNRTEKEIYDRLKKETNDEHVIENVIYYLKSITLIDDINFAKSFYDNKRRLNNWSSKKILYELKFKGINNFDLNEYFDDVYDVDYSNAKFFIDKKINSWTKKYDKYKLKSKMYSFLTQKGFDYNIVNSIIEEYLK